MKKNNMITINGEMLKEKIKMSPFTFTQLGVFCGSEGNYPDQAIWNYVRRGKIPHDKLIKICSLLDIREESIKVTKEPEPTKVVKPIHANKNNEEYKDVNWMIALYRAIEDANDRLDTLIAETKANTVAIRELQETLNKQDTNAILDDIRKAIV